MFSETFHTINSPTIELKQVPPSFIHIPSSVDYMLNAHDPDVQCKVNQHIL